MAYQTGSVATATQLLDALRVFAVANGWTENRWGAQGAGYQLSLQRNGLHVHLRSAVSETLESVAPGCGFSRTVTGIWLTGATGYSSGSAWSAQPGTIKDTGNAFEAVGLYELSGANTCHLFANAAPDQILLVAEVTPGTFHFLAFGELQKFGAYSGGAFVCASYSGDNYTYTSTSDYVFGYGNDGHMGLPFNDYKTSSSNCGGYVYGSAVDGWSGWFSVTGGSTPTTGKKMKGLFEGGMSFTPRNSLGRYWWDYCPNVLNGVTPMIPWQLFVERPSGYFSPFGYTPHLRYLNIANYSAGEVFTLGAEQWMVFPAHSKGNKSGNHGFAVRRID